MFDSNLPVGCFLWGRDRVEVLVAKSMITNQYTVDGLRKAIAPSWDPADLHKIKIYKRGTKEAAEDPLTSSIVAAGDSTVAATTRFPIRTIGSPPASLALWSNSSVGNLQQVVFQLRQPKPWCGLGFVCKRQCSRRWMQLPPVRVLCVNEQLQYDCEIRPAIETCFEHFKVLMQDHENIRPSDTHLVMKWQGRLMAGVEGKVVVVNMVYPRWVGHSLEQCIREHILAKGFSADGLLNQKKPVRRVTHSGNEPA